MSADNWISATLFIIFLFSLVAGYASLFDSEYPTARQIHRKYKRQRADLRKVLKGKI